MTFESVQTECEFDLGRPISDNEELEEILKIDTSKSSGMLNLGTRVLKECMIQAYIPFTNLLNKCIEHGVFPKRWKDALVIPITKGMKKRTVENIRPIPLLPSLGKIFENILHRRIYTYLESTKLLCAEQSGFRKIPDYRLNLFVNNQFNKGNFLVCIFIDLAKAFN